MEKANFYDKQEKRGKHKKETSKIKNKKLVLKRTVGLNCLVDGVMFKRPKKTNNKMIH